MSNSTMQEIEADVVVVGGGGAGLRAAYEAAVAGARTVLVLKGRITKSGATAFGVAELAGFSVPDGAADPQDSPDVHYDDIMRAGKGCNDERLVRVLVDEAVAAAEDIQRWGVEFITDPNTGNALVAMGDFASRPRNRKIYHHGRPITVALEREVRAAGVTVLEDNTVLGLLQGDDGVGGVLCLAGDGTRTCIRAGATVLATGGAGQLFEFSLMPPDITGDGYALGYRAGASLVNMEFIQAGFGTIKPSLNIIMAWFWALQPGFIDRDGKPLLDGVLPPGLSVETVMKTKVKHYPFSASDESRWLEIAAKRAMDEGRVTPLGGFRLDLRNVDESRLAPGSDLAVMWPVSKEWMRKKRLDFENQPLEIGLFGHAINGGLVISEYCETTVPGLLAVGETAGGPYGADRLGGNMLLNCQVFGRRAGRRAAELGRARTARARKAALPRVDYLLQAKGEQDVRGAIRRIKQAMTRDVLIIRNESGLNRAEQALATLHDEIVSGRFRAETVKEQIALSEATNLLDTGRMIVAAARLRKETRGSHYREDYPGLDPSMAKPVFIKREGDACRVALRTYREVMP